MMSVLIVGVGDAQWVDPSAGRLSPRFDEAPVGAGHLHGARAEGEEVKGCGPSERGV
jgi:hypothetical protein